MRELSETCSGLYDHIGDTSFEIPLVSRHPNADPNLASPLRREILMLIREDIPKTLNMGIDDILELDCFTYYQMVDTARMYNRSTSGKKKKAVDALMSELEG